MDMYSAFRQAVEEGETIPDEVWEFMRPYLKLRHFKKGEFIVRQGQVENYMSAIAKGCVRLFIVRNEEEICYEFVFENEFANSYASFLSREPSRLFLQAIEDVTLVSIHHDNLQGLYSGSAIGERIGRLITEANYIYREERELMLLTHTPEEMYLDLLSHYPDYINRIPQKYLASYLNMKPESLSRIKRRIYEDKGRT